MQMLTKEGCRARCRRLFEKLSDPPDWIVVADPQHQMYFANYYQSPFVFRSTNAGAILILGRDGTSILVADNLVEGFARLAHVDGVVAPIWYRSKESAPHREAMLVRSTLDRLDGCAGTFFGMESASVPVGIVEGLRSKRGNLKLVDVDPIIHEMKRSKDADELVLMRRSMEAGAAGHQAGMRDIKPGMTELEAYLVVQSAAMEKAGDQAVVYGDFVSGPRCEQIGGPPTQRVIEKNDLVLLDFSVIVYGYRGDFANTFACQGKPTGKQAEWYQACAEAMREGEKLLKAGQDCRTVDRAVRDSLDRRHLGEYFPHHTGHGLGLGHPDPPYLVPESSDTLVAGDVVTIEPGLYSAGIGGMRYERNYLITNQGYDLLSHHAIAIEPSSA